MEKELIVRELTFQRRRKRGMQSLSGVSTGWLICQAGSAPFGKEVLSFPRKLPDHSPYF